MPTAQYTALASVTLSVTTTSIIFSGISQNYKDLVLVGSASVTTSSSGFGIKLNSDGAGLYSIVNMNGTGTSAGSGATFAANAFMNATWNGSLATERALFKIDILDYAATDKHKPAIIRFNRPGGNTELIMGRWANTNAANRIDIVASTQQFAAGSTFELYGVK